MDKFYKLERYLSTKIEDEFELSFNEIERILGFELAYSAYKYTAYWQPSSTHTFANTVEMCGFKMKPNLYNKTVIFYRDEYEKAAKKDRVNEHTINKKKILPNNVEQMDEASFSKFVDRFIYVYSTDANSRYMSYDHIRKAFLYNRENENSRDYITLNLYAYLASWGMLRNSFLMQKDYTFSRPVVDVLCSNKYKSLINYNPLTDNGLSKATLIEELIWDIKRCYIGKEYFEEGSNQIKKIDNVTDTLVSKIILGTLGCTVAYDRYVKLGLSSHKLSQKLSYDSIIELRDFAKANDIAIRKALSRLGDIYTPMKILDMYFFEKGFEEEKNKSK